MNGPAAVKEGTDISDTEDVESSIQRELESMKPSTSSLAFTFVKLDIPCGWCFHNAPSGLSTPSVRTLLAYILQFPL
jgi:hypothetical protein